MALGLNEADARGELDGKVEVLIAYTEASQLTLPLQYSASAAYHVDNIGLTMSIDIPDSDQLLSLFRIAAASCVPMNVCSENFLVYRDGSGFFDTGGFGSQVLVLCFDG